MSRSRPMMAARAPGNPVQENPCRAHSRSLMQPKYPVPETHDTTPADSHSPSSMELTSLNKNEIPLFNLPQEIRNLPRARYRLRTSRKVDPAMEVNPRVGSAQGHTWKRTTTFRPKRQCRGWQQSLAQQLMCGSSNHLKTPGIDSRDWEILGTKQSESLQKSS
jgi:hypothetical protein